MSTPDKVLKTATEHTDARIRFYAHGVVYAGVIALLWLINSQSDTGDWWAIWPTAGWGIGLLLHGLDALIWQQRDPRNSLRQRMIDAEVKKQTAQQ